MRYSIRAEPRIAELGRFWKLLNDGTIGNQEPDGTEILASMKRARITDGRVEWDETCYCSPPLEHERTAVYDHFFTQMEIKPLGSIAKSQGDRFWDYLRDNSKGDNATTSKGLSRIRLRHVPLRIL